MTNFRKGDSTGIIAGDRAALVVAPPSAPLCVLLRQNLASVGSFTDLVDLIARLGLSGLPSFVVVVPDGNTWRVLQRGEMQSSFESVSGATWSLDAAATSSWREESFSDVRRAVLGSDEGDFPYSTHSGLVPAEALLLGDRPDRPRDDGEVLEHALEGSSSDSTLTFGAESSPDGDAVRPWYADDPMPSADPAPFAPPQAPPVPPAVANDSLHSDELANLVDHTFYRDIEAAAIRSSDGGVEASLPERAAEGEPDPDHDGRTVILPRGRSGTPAAASAGSVVSLCGAGHANPREASVCRACGTAVPGDRLESVHVLRPGVLRFSNGMEHHLENTVVIGRQPPDSPSVDGGRAASLTIPHPELSRSHATVHVDGWNVLVSDNGSLNGSKVLVPGRPPEVCRAEQRVLLVPGSVVDLGGAVTFRFDVL